MKVEMILACVGQDVYQNYMQLEKEKAKLYILKAISCFFFF